MKRTKKLDRNQRGRDESDLNTTNCALTRGSEENQAYKIVFMLSKSIYCFGAVHPVSEEQVDLL